MTPDSIPPNTAGRIAATIGGSLVAATLITTVFVLPAEYGVDPTGIGSVLGLTQIATPSEVTVETRFSAPPEIAVLKETSFKTETIEIEVNPFMVNYGALEYKISMNEGDILLYEWESDLPLVSEFHGHTVDDESGAPIEVMDYIADKSSSARGTLVAPMDGIHGWYFANSAFDQPAKVTLRLAGYFELEPGIMELSR
jgi:hypothetical protein